MIHYSAEETQYLIDHRFKDTSKTIAADISVIFGTNRSSYSVNQRLARINMPKPRPGNFTVEESALIETFIDCSDINRLVKLLTDKFGTNHTRGSIVCKRSKLRARREKSISARVLHEHDKIIETELSYQNKAGNIVISTLELAYAMTDAEYNIRSLSLKVGLSESHVMEMLTRTGVCERHAARIKSVLGMKV